MSKKQNIAPLYQDISEQNFAMKQLQSFFLFCSGVERSLLERCPSDINKYAGIGATVFFTGVLAFCSSGFAFYTVFYNSWLAVFFGLIWGLMIFNLDRYIVMSMKSIGKRGRDWLVALPRILLAILLALVISKPLEMKIFEPEIKAELIVMEQAVFKQQEDQVKTRFAAELQENEAKIAVWKAEISKKIAARDTLLQETLREADGTGGSGKKNLGPIYRAKKAASEKAELELQQTLALNQPLIWEKEAKSKAILENIQKENAGLQRSKYDGLAARMEALARLGERSMAIFWASLFITLLFIAIETAPILVKLISYRSPYDYLLQEHEHVFEMATKESTTLRNNKINHQLRFDTETGQHLVVSSIALEKALIDYKLKEKLEELKTKPFQWKWNPEA